MYSLVVSAKMNDIDPRAWLAYVLANIAQHPASRLDVLSRWNRRHQMRSLARLHDFAAVLTAWILRR
jgi:hypothetical protein